MKPTDNVARVFGLAMCCIPKCANSSIKWALMDALGVPQEYRRQRHVMLNLCTPTPAELKGHYTAAFLRYLVARLYSCWHDKIRRPKGRASRLLAADGFTIGMPFAEFVEQVTAQPCEDLHLRPQVDFLATQMDFVGTVESIERDWRALQVRFPWLPDIGRENVSANDDWFPHCAGLIDRINEYYAADLELWAAANGDDS